MNWIESTSNRGKQEDPRELQTGRWAIPSLMTVGVAQAAL